MNAGKTFAGFTVIATRESDLYYIEDGVFVYEGAEYEVTRLCSKSAAHTEYVVNIVTCSDRVIWNHDDAGYAGVALLAVTQYGPVVALCKGGCVKRIVPFVRHRGFDDIIDFAEAKREAAESIGYKPWYSDSERRALMLEQEIIRLGESERRHRAHIETEEARAALLMRVMKRPYISVITEKGMRHRGIPVRDAEWSMLPMSLTAVLVEDLTKPLETALQVFEVVTNVRGVVERQHVQQVAR